MSKKPLNFKAPAELVQLLDIAAGNSTRSLFSIKLLRSFFNEKPALRDLTGLMSQEICAFTLRLPEDIVEELDTFANSMAYTRHSAIIVAMMAQLGHQGFTPRPVIPLGR